MNYDNEYQKHITIQSYKEFLQKHYSDHQIFFVTITFKNTFIRSKSLPAYNVLLSLSQKLNQASASRYSTKSKKNRFLCIREKSHPCKAASMRKEDHYHCFFMMSKNYLERFHRKAVQDSQVQYSKAVEKDILKLILHPEIYNNKRALKDDPSIEDVTYEFLNPQDSLKPDTVDVRVLTELDDVLGS